jgi:hypothetical protein
MSRKPFDSRNPDYVYAEIPTGLEGWVIVNFLNALTGHVNRTEYLIQHEAGGDPQFLEDARAQLKSFKTIYPQAEELAKKMSASWSD